MGAAVAMKHDESNKMLSVEPRDVCAAQTVKQGPFGYIPLQCLSTAVVEKKIGKKLSIKWIKVRALSERILSERLLQKS